MKYEVTDGLDAEDYIAYPMDTIQEGDPVIYNDYMSMGLGGMNMDMGEMDMDGEMLSDPGADVFDLDQVKMQSRKIKAGRFFCDPEIRSYI